MILLIKMVYNISNLYNYAILKKLVLLFMFLIILFINYFNLHLLYHLKVYLLN